MTVGVDSSCCLIMYHYSSDSPQFDLLSTQVDGARMLGNGFCHVKDFRFVCMQCSVCVCIDVCHKSHCSLSVRQDV
jgi:hypothetical protein